tara:strand:- start:2293 stop:2511 length:219 start_codon:yes stop_codon:yes gene_type:complete
MKTIQMAEVVDGANPSTYIRRVKDEEALKLVSSGEWIFTSKTSWKQLVRDVNNTTNKEEKKNKKRKKAKRDN